MKGNKPGQPARRRRNSSRAHGWAGRRSPRLRPWAPHERRSRVLQNNAAPSSCQQRTNSRQPSQMEDGGSVQICRSCSGPQKGGWTIPGSIHKQKPRHRPRSPAHLIAQRLHYRRLPLNVHEASNHRSLLVSERLVMECDVCYV
jgi:putative hemolysin